MNLGIPTITGILALLDFGILAAVTASIFFAAALAAVLWQQRRLKRLRSEYRKLRHDFTQANERAAGSRAEKTQVLRIAVQSIADPVRSLRSDVEAALQTDKLPDELREQFQRIHGHSTEVSLALRALDELQSLENRARSLSMVPINVGALLIEASSRCIALAEEKQVRISPPDPSKSWQVLADVDVLRKVLESLLVDAIEVTPRHGTVTLSAYQATDRVLLTVSDEGPGTSVSDQASLLDQSGTSRSPFSPGGARLNLAMIHNYIKSMDGWFWSQGEPGGGTTHVVELALMSPRKNRTLAGRGSLEAAR